MKWILVLSWVSAVISLDMTLLHTNDVHSRFRQANAAGFLCTEMEEARDTCFGGFPRLYYKAEEIRKSHPNVIYLSGGDYYQGTVWYTVFKSEVVVHFVNKLNHTAMALGNHEFDDGVAGLVPLLENASFPIISANIDTSKEDQLRAKLNGSVIVEYEGRKVGVIGYTTPETMDISNPGKTLYFGNITEAVAREARAMNEAGVNIIFAVGHAGYLVDLEVAKVPYVDVVVGGHTNTFLFNGTQPHLEIPEDEYPRVVVKDDGSQVPVVQAFAYGKYLGYLNLTFDVDGNLTWWNGNPILLDHRVPQDPQMLKEINEWNRKVTEKTEVEIGRTRVLLDGERLNCRHGECNMGNVVADAQVLHYLKFADGDTWADVTLGIVHSGSIRGSMSEQTKNGSITMKNILDLQPFGANIDVMTIRGKHLRQAFEFSVAGFDPEDIDPAGKFLQVSGIRIVYDITQEDGHRVKRISVLCRECRVPHYQPLEDEKIYHVAVPGFLVTGGSGYDVLKAHTIEHFTAGVIDTDVLVEYFSQNLPVTQGLEGRITFESDEVVKSSCRKAGFIEVKAAMTPLPIEYQSTTQEPELPEALTNTTTPSNSFDINTTADWPATSTILAMTPTNSIDVNTTSDTLVDYATEVATPTESVDVTPTSNKLMDYTTEVTTPAESLDVNTTSNTLVDYTTEITTPAESVDVHTTSNTLVDYTTEITTPTESVDVNTTSDWLGVGTTPTQAVAD